MPQYHPVSEPNAFREMQQKIRDLTARVENLEGRRLLEFPRGLTANIPAPAEGEVLVQADNDRAWYYANGEWRPFSPPGFSFKLFADPGALDGELGDTATEVTTGDGKYEFSIPESFDGLDLVYADAYVSTVSSSGAITVQVRNSTLGVDVLSTRITIDQDEFTSRTAAAPFVVNAANARCVDGHMWAIDVDTAGSGATGLGVNLEFGRLT